MSVRDVTSLVKSSTSGSPPSICEMASSAYWAAHLTALKISARRLGLASQLCEDGPGPISSERLSIVGRTPLRALMASVPQDAQVGSLI